jgi:hypothetical protein
MGDITGGLIEMNAHMITTQRAQGLMLIGCALAVIGLIALIVIVVDKNVQTAWKSIVIAGVVVTIGCAMVYSGTRIPRVKEIHACADGAVSLESIAARYDIVSVDGKELVLRVR